MSEVFVVRIYRVFCRFEGRRVIEVVLELGSESRCFLSIFLVVKFFIKGSLI